MTEVRDLTKRRRVAEGDNAVTKPPLEGSKREGGSGREGSKRPRGFASMDADKRRELQSRGGSAKRARPFDDRELARKAGRLGGINKHRTKRGEDYE